MKITFISSLLAVAVLCGLLSGCGSGDKSTAALSTASDSSRAPAGTVQLKIKWPSRAAKSRVIPTATTDIGLVVTSQTGIFTDTQTNTKTVTVAYDTPSISVTGVPVGTCLVQGFALLKNSDGTQVVLATLNTPLQATITANQNTQVVLTLQATLTAATTAVTATIQKILNPDGTAAAAADPLATPQPLSTTTTLQNLTDGAVYKVAAVLNAAPGIVPLPSAAEFTFTTVNNTSFAKPFLTSVDASGNVLATAAVGGSAYFKINASGSNGNVVVTLNTPFTDPSLTPVSGAFPLSATVPLLARLTGRGAFQVKDASETYYHLIENNFAAGNLTPRVLVGTYSATGSQGQLYNTLNPVYDPAGRWLAFSAIQQAGASPDPASADSYGIILIDTKAAIVSPVNLTASLPQFAHARCQDPHWSPDGAKIIFQTNTNAGVYQLHTLDVDLTKTIPTAVEDANSPTSLAGADPLLLSDGSIIYVTKISGAPDRVAHWQASTGTVPLTLPAVASGPPFISSYYANTFGSGLVFTVNQGDGTSDQLALYNLSTNQATLLEPAINTATNNSDPADAGSGLLLYSRTVAGPYHLFVALPGSTLAPQEIDFLNVPAASSIVGATYTP